MKSNRQDRVVLPHGRIWTASLQSSFSVHFPCSEHHFLLCCFCPTPCNLILGFMDFQPFTSTEQSHPHCFPPAPSLHPFRCWPFLFLPGMAASKHVVHHSPMLEQSPQRMCFWVLALEDVLLGPQSSTSVTTRATYVLAHIFHSASTPQQVPFGFFYFYRTIL